MGDARERSFDRGDSRAVGKHRSSRWVKLSHRALIPHANFREKGAHHYIRSSSSSHSFIYLSLTFSYYLPTLASLYRFTAT